MSIIDYIEQQLGNPITKLYQRMLGVTSDGIWGPRSQRAWDRSFGVRLAIWLYVALVGVALHYDLARFLQ